jgi:excisionase family DNA binding protein
MQSTLEKEDLTAIAKEVSKLLAPLFKKTEQGSGNDTIFNLKEISEYIKLPKSWIYRKTSDRTIPFIKAGRYVLFKKPEIDKWLEEKSVNPIPKH